VSDGSLNAGGRGVDRLRMTLAVEDFVECALRERLLSTTDVAEMLFCTDLQPSDHPGPGAVRDAVGRRLRQQSDPLSQSMEECAARHGDEPELARRRMRWSLSLVAAAYPSV
jgi:hypothetical protein